MNNDDNYKRSNSIPDGNGNFQPELDPEKYRNGLSELNLTEEQENEMLGILFSIMNSFVQLGFDVKNCGQIFESFTQAAQNESDGLESSHSSKQEKPTRGDRRHE
ncbi:MAG: hypothetical protein P1V21_26900 [Rhizobiaceae bacterium]|nr:hypothetical protein [Rhizobiaceae bacterium]